MKKIILVFLILTFICTVYAFDELWQKAQALAENSWRLVPGRSIVSSLTVSDNQSMRIGFDFEVAHTLDTDGNILTEIISYTTIDDFGVDFREILSENMEELFEDELNEMFDGDFDIEEFEMGESFEFISEKEINDIADDFFKDMIPKRTGMFFETNSRNITVNRTRETKMINSRFCQAYEVSYTNTGRRRDRDDVIVWLEVSTGAPVLTESRPRRTPPFVRSVIINTHYVFNEETNQFFVELFETVTEISILRQRMSMTLSVRRGDYWEYPVVN